MAMMYGNTLTSTNTGNSMWCVSQGTCTSTATSTTWTGVNTWNNQTTATGFYQIFDAQMAAAQMQQMQIQAQQIYVAQMQMQSAPQRSTEQRMAYEEQIAKIEEAKERAKGLLLGHLTASQKETFEKNKWFVVEGGKSKQQYRIRAESHTINIDVMDGKKVKHKLCAHLRYDSGAPLHDHILAQKLMLESAEDDFLKIANRHAA